MIAPKSSASHTGQPSSQTTIAALENHMNSVLDAVRTVIERHHVFIKERGSRSATSINPIAKLSLAASWIRKCESPQARTSSRPAPLGPIAAPAAIRSNGPGTPNR